MSGSGQSFTVDCQRCSHRFHAIPRASAHFAKCPECAEPNRVPATAELEELANEESEAETYRIAIPSDWEEPTAATPPQTADEKTPTDGKPKPSEIPHREVPENAAATKISCPNCGADFAPPISEQTQNVLCPECLEDVIVPPLSERQPSASMDSAPADNTENSIPWDAYLLDTSESKEDAPKPGRKERRSDAAAAWDMEPSPEKTPTRRERPKNVHDTMAEIRRDEEDPPPEWTFFSGVVDFLIRPEVAVKWAYASFGCCLFGWLLFLCLHFYETFPMALGFFVLPLIWVTIMAFSYIGSHAMPILMETAAGKDVIEGWPDPVMKEQAVDLVYLAFLGIVTEALSFFVAQFVSVVIGPVWAVGLVLGFLLYPIVLLSSLEANTPFIPLTAPILKSLSLVTWAWGVFYALCGGLLLAWVLPVIWLISATGMTQFFAMFVVGPMMAGWCFLAARLLGRLAWRASLEFPDEEEDAESSETDKPAKMKKKREKNRAKQKPITGSPDSSGELRTARS